MDKYFKSKKRSPSSNDSSFSPLALRSLWTPNEKAYDLNFIDDEITEPIKATNLDSSSRKFPKRSRKERRYDPVVWWMADAKTTKTKASDAVRTTKRPIYATGNWTGKRRTPEKSSLAATSPTPNPLVLQADAPKKGKEKRKAEDSSSWDMETRDETLSGLSTRVFPGSETGPLRKKLKLSQDALSDKLPPVTKVEPLVFDLTEWSGDMDSPKSESVGTTEEGRENRGTKRILEDDDFLTPDRPLPLRVSRKPNDSEKTPPNTRNQSDMYKSPASHQKIRRVRGNSAPRSFSQPTGSGGPSKFFHGRKSSGSQSCGRRKFSFNPAFPFSSRYVGGDGGIQKYLGDYSLSPGPMPDRAMLLSNDEGDETVDDGFLENLFEKGSESGSSQGDNSHVSLLDFHMTAMNLD